MEEDNSFTDQTRHTPDANDTCYETVRGSKDTDQGNSPELRIERVRDGRDSFGMLKSEQLHLDAGVYSGSLSNDAPSYYIATLERRKYFVWEEWTREWSRRRVAKDVKAQNESKNKENVGYPHETGQELIRAREEEGGIDESEVGGSVLLTPTLSMFGEEEYQMEGVVKASATPNRWC